MVSVEICPNCGADVPLKALACPECGSDEETGWSENTLYDGLDLPEDEEPQESRDPFMQKYLKLIAIAVAVAFLLTYVL